MARRILDEEPSDSHRRVLFLTFSRSATAELAKRAPDALAGPRGARIDISTFHSFAMSMLNGFRRYAGGPTEPVVIQTREQVALRLAPAGSLGFDDLVPAALTLLHDAPWLVDAYRARYAAVICDEFQDTPAPSAELLDSLAPGRQMVCLADSDQVIFDWTDSTITRRITDYLASGAVKYDLGYDSRRDPSNVIPRAAAAIRDRDLGAEALREACQAGRLRVLQHGGEEEPFDVLVDEVRASLADAAQDVGVFFATNRSVNDFAERLREEGIEHEIVGLSGAAGDAQVAVAAAASFVAGSGTWHDFLRALGVFVAACYRGKPPDLAVSLAHEPNRLPTGLIALLDHEREELASAGGESLERFLQRMETLWRRIFTGRPRALWETGVRSLAGQTLAVRRRPLDAEVVSVITRVAQEQRASYLVDSAPWLTAPVRVMNVYQVKGREMDEAFLVHLPDDRDEWSFESMARLRRVHYVSLSRARRRATILLPPEPKSFFAPYAGICAD
jgi:DNA helicase-2/ATP-dependent DNA helicase PcrA